MALIPEDEERLRRYLSEARDALHRVSIGRQKVQVRADTGETVQYSPATVSDLRAYIADLETRLGIRSGRGPIQLAF
ncbi:gpW family head-tail joining protein [Azospirillum picis]|uniref:Phage tail protein n=1 Tax=Azospirillum picis TaxID=488438 RepID=A0ABU0MUG9_9PROT|nr:gpW family head-tail joining protein [Azospirillum picis]MBP2303317.1 hypothetical protein [Azospirillum picis]MDQ0537143.1 hypothetical protein [Azospirillum picis]